MKEGLDRKQLLIPVLLIILLSVNVFLVTAQQFDFNDTILSRLDGVINQSDAKIMVMIMLIAFIMWVLKLSGIKNYVGNFLIALPLAFVLTVFVAPEAIVGAFASYDSFIASFLALVPLLVLTLFTYSAVQSNNAAALRMQLVFWWVVFIVTAIKALAAGLVAWGGLSPSSLSFISLPSNPAFEFWYWTTTSVIGIIALTLAVFNNKLIQFMSNQMAQIDDTVARRNVDSEVRGRRAMREHGNS